MNCIDKSKSAAGSQGRPVTASDINYLQRLVASLVRVDVYLCYSHNSKDRLSDLVAEHLDHLHYLNDILCLNIDALNEVLTDHLLNNLLLPLYVYSLTKRNKYELHSVGVNLLLTIYGYSLCTQV